MRWPAALRVFGASVVLGFASSVMAATLVVNGSGQLTGATGIVVNGVSYDVAFADGTCAALFNGCDNSSDFTFHSEPDADQAANILLNAIHSSPAFDADPTLTFGCSAPGMQCLMEVPYIGGAVFTAFAAENNAFGLGDGATLDFQSVDYDVTTDFMRVFALFSPREATAPIPEPTTWAMMLFGFGIVAVAMPRRCKRRGRTQLA